MKRWKWFTLITIAAIFLMGNLAFATCEGDDCDGGDIEVYTSAYGDYEDLIEEYGTGYGAAAGFSGQGGAEGILTGSFQGEGSIEGHLSATGASIGHMETYYPTIENGEGVGAYSENWSQGLLSGSIEGEGTGRYDLQAAGLALSTTCAASYYGGEADVAPTYGLAEQTAYGYFLGTGGAEFDGTLSEEFQAGVESFGFSYSESYGQEYDNVSALGSNVGTYSQIQVTADNLPDGMETGWRIEGQAGTVTEMSTNHEAMALGSYCAEGTTGYADGFANGYSYTSVVTPESGWGEIRHSQAGMAVEVNLTAPTTE